MKPHAALPLLLVALALPACRQARSPQRPGVPEALPATPAEPTEAERTRRLQQEAADLNRRFEEIQSQQLSEQEKQRAVEELMARQQEAIRASDGPPPP